MATTYRHIYIHVVFTVEEYVEMLDKSKVEYEDKYLFRWINDDQNG